MLIRNRNLFRITRFILLRLPKVFKILRRAENHQKRLLIIKTDAIGDYILFRNFIEVVKNSTAYAGHQVDLLGNELWQEIAIAYDSRFINRFYFITADELYESPMQTLKLAFGLFRTHYDVVLQPSFSRTFITDALAGFTAANKIIAFESDCERISSKYKRKTDRFYTELIADPGGITFEFDRTRFFFEKALNQKISLLQPWLEVKTGVKSGIIVAMGAGVAKRCWETEKLFALINMLLQNTVERLYLVGDADEQEVAAEIMRRFAADRIDNLTGRTSLIELIERIANASLLVSSETAAVHVAAAVRTPSVCITGGGHFGRFVPYPPNADAGPVCVYHQMECYNCNWECRFKTIENEPFPCISGIGFTDLAAAVRMFL